VLKLQLNDYTYHKPIFQLNYCTPWREKYGEVGINQPDVL